MNTKAGEKKKPQKRRHRVTWFEFASFKSLREVYFNIEPLTILLGANGAGKSNLVDAVEFLSDVYRVGVESAFSDLGLYDAIYYRDFDEVSGSVSLGVDVDVDAGIALSIPRVTHRISVTHQFSISRLDVKATGAPRISSERLSISLGRGPNRLLLLHVTRNRDGAVTVAKSDVRRAKLPRDLFAELAIIEDLVTRSWRISESELLVTAISRLSPVLGAFMETVSGISVYELDPEFAREESPRQLRPRLSRYGENLPSVISQIKKNSGTAWKTILGYMRDIRPGLDDIIVKRSRSGQQILIFEESSGQWRSSEVSNGTIRSLAALTAIFDPASALVMLEEPENSLHPWMARRLVDACKEASAIKDVVLTTHSPIVMSLVDPNSVLVMWNSGKGSKLSSLRKLDPQDISLWEAGEINAFDVIDSGIVPEAVPQRS